MEQKPSGTDMDLGDNCSRIAYQWARKTFSHRQGLCGEPCLEIEASFANILEFSGVKIGIASDGIGTKIEIAERLQIYRTLGFDLVAMIVDDLVCNGMEPVALENILDVDYLEAAVVDELMHGLYEAAKKARIAVTGGEIAELGSRISGYGQKMHFNWGATGIGVLPKDRKIIDGGDIEPGDAIISLKSNGFRSNGYSRIRQILQSRFGNQWHAVPYDKLHTWGELLLTPCDIFAPAVFALIQNGLRLKGIAHVTGGGIMANLKRVLEKTKSGAFLDDLYEPVAFMKQLQRIGSVEEKEAYRLWNMGNGMLIVIAREQSDLAITSLYSLGHLAKVVGQVVAEPEITVCSNGAYPQTLRREL